jgi:subtilisin family serine protease
VNSKRNVKKEVTMSNGNHVLIVEGAQIPLRRLENVRAVTPSRDEHPMRVAARLARSSRLALDPTYPHDLLVFWGEKQKLEEVRTYPDIQNTRCAFHDPDGKLLVLTNDILIGFVDGSSDDDRERLLAQLDGRVIQRKAEIWKFQVNDPAEDAPLLLANQLSEENIVEYAEPNAVQAVTYHQLPQNEPLFGNQWHLQNTGQNGGIAGADVDALGAWAITTGSPNIAIVVHDSGVDINHPDLAANIGPGWDFDNSDNNATNNNGPHGTACAGIIAAAVNGQGVTGVAPGCRIIPLRAAGAHTFQTWADTFDWAAQHGQIISCSWSITPNNTLSAAIRRAVNNGITVFCATGNAGTGSISYPASINETIAVGASNNLDVRASYSQFGNGLDIVAPSSGPRANGSLRPSGGTLRIETTDNQGVNGYNTANSPAGDYCNANDGTGFGGTSAATPLAAGVAALMLSINPSLSPDDIRSILHRTADKIDQANGNYDANGWSTQYGYGRINAALAVHEARPRQAVIAMIPYKQGVITAFSGGGIYYSPDGNNLGGGGNTTRVYSGRQTVIAMISYKLGVITAFSGGGIYYSRDGNNLGGGGSTKRVYSGRQTVIVMIPYKKGVVTAFSGGGIYYSRNGNNLGGGGSTNRVYSGKQTVIAMIAYVAGIITAFSGKGIYYSPDGNNLGGGGNTIRVY